MYVGIYLHNIAWFDDEWLKSTNKITNMFQKQCDVVSSKFDMKVNIVFESWFMVSYL